LDGVSKQNVPAVRDFALDFATAKFISLHTLTAGCNELTVSCNELVIGCNARLGA
jgi:hypothetical protein